MNTTTVVSDDEFVTYARSLQPKLKERAEEADRTRTLPEATVEDLRAINYVGAALSPRHGGFNLGFDTISRASVELAEACGATGWVAANSALHSFMTGYFPADVQDEVFADTARTPFIGNGLKMSNAKAVSERGGYRLTGRWDFSSGILHADWTTVAAVSDIGPKLFLVHKSQFTIADTWNTHGLRGTGSHDTVIEDQFISEQFVIDIESLSLGTGPGLEIQTNPFYRVPIFSLSGSGIIATM